MFKNNIVIFGDGLLGHTIYILTGWNILSRSKDGIDINDPSTYKDCFSQYRQVLNCVGYTNTYSENSALHWKTNYLALMDLVDTVNTNKQKLIHISTDYIYANSKPFATEKDPPSNAPNWYSYTKLLGDAYIQARCKKYLIIRTSFKPDPFPYEEAITCQIGNFDYVDVIAKKIIALIQYNANGIFNVGTQMKSIYDLALKTRPDVKPVNEKIHETMPIDVTMNISKMTKFLEVNNASD